MNLLADLCVKFFIFCKDLNPVYTKQNYLDRNLDCYLGEEAPVYTGRSLFNITKIVTLLFVVQSLLYRNSPNMWIEIIQIEFLHTWLWIQIAIQIIIV